MSLLSHLFHRHQQPAVAPTLTVKWPGKSGALYPYEVHAIDASFHALPGNYIYAREGEDGNWVPLYIAQTRDLHQRLEGHVSVADARTQGATHIHVHLSTTGQAARCTEEHDLVSLWKPVCNDPAEG